jgi:hypothetical protein
MKHARLMFALLAVLALSTALSAQVASQPAQDAERFFGGILQSLISTTVPQLATTVLGLLQQRRRELEIPDQRDAASVERDLQAILNAMLPQLIQAVPAIAGALSGRPAPRGAEEEGQRFLPFLAAVLPAVISAVPSIISAFNQQRGADTTPPSISDPDVAQRFIGPLLQTFVPQLLQAAPSILQTIFGGGSRDVRAAW